MPTDKTPEEEAEEIMNESDETVEDLTADTEVYDEVDNEVEDSGPTTEDESPAELDFEPADDVDTVNEDFEPDDAA